MIIAQSVALSIGFVLDLIFGDPNFALHPVRLMGKVILLFEKVFRKIFPKTKGGEIIGGLFTVIFVIAVCGGVPFAILFFAYRVNVMLGVAAESVICYFMLAAKSLKKAGDGVYNSLMRENIEDAREKVSMIVGRDTENLDEEGITKATVETIAENTSDGVCAPLIFMMLGGGVLGCVYKAINTMDSMLGYKNNTYINFGKCAALLDDIVNYIPSRISAFFMIISSYMLGFDGDSASRIHKRDGRKHASPNSAQTEAVMAGALGIQLAGDAYYFGELYKKPFIGDSIKDVKYIHIKHASKLMYATAFFVFFMCIILKAAVWAAVHFKVWSIFI